MSTASAPRRITVFGASGAVGLHAVKSALDRGHEVVAHVRTPAKVTIEHPKLTVLTGELSEREKMRDAVRGSDAVISALGPSLDRKAKDMPLVEGTRNIIDGMQAEGIQRFIGMATPSLRDPRDGRSALGVIVPFMGRTFLARAYRELLDMSQIVIDGDLDWTIARFTRPTDGSPTGTVRAGFLGKDKVGASITRADIGAFLVDQLDDDRFHRAAPAISN
jgi:putative NADH-flavin reductase